MLSCAIMCYRVFMVRDVTSSVVTCHHFIVCHRVSCVVTCYHVSSCDITYRHLSSCAVMCSHVVLCDVTTHHVSCIMCYHVPSRVMCHHVSPRVVMCHHVSCVITCHHVLSCDITCHVTSRVPPRRRLWRSCATLLPSAWPRWLQGRHVTKPRAGACARHWRPPGTGPRPPHVT